MRVLLVLLSFILMSACSLKGPEQRAPYTPGELSMIDGCRDWVQEIEVNSNAQFMSIPDNQKAFVYIHRDTMGMIESVWGKGEVDLCQPQSDYARAYEAYVNGQTEIAVTALKEAGAATRTIAYVAGVLGVADSLASTEKTTDTSVTEKTTDISSTTIE